MGVQLCDCQGLINTDGVYDFILFSVAYDVFIDICPGCGLEESDVDVEFVFTSAFSALNFKLTFAGGPVGLPTCDGDTLTVTLAGVLTIDADSLPIDVTIVLDAAEQQICINLPEPVPIFGDQICLPAPVDVEACA